ncbi:MAG: class I SAM-dependent methyltransferase [Cyanobacteria bacterium P01_G01_bin.19]
MSKTDTRIEREKQFHDERYSDDRRKQQVGKFYSITDSITKAYKQKILAASHKASTIEYGCGVGSYAFFLAQNQVELVTGIDISSIAIKLAKEKAAEQGLGDKIDFQIMNAENLEFAESSYDLICGSGILHHLNLDLATNSIVRTLKPKGKAIFIEPLGHNFLINTYRRLTPNIRSQDEHPLLTKDLDAIKANFKQSKIQYFYLTSLAASLIANKPGFAALLGFCQWLDSILLKLPGIRQQAWMVLIELEQPIK